MAALYIQIDKVLKKMQDKELELGVLRYDKTAE